MHHFWIDNIWSKLTLVNVEVKLFYFTLTERKQPKQNLLFFVFRRLPAVTAPSSCGTLRSRFARVSVPHTFILYKMSICRSDADSVFIQTQVISWPLLQKTNDVSNAKSLCRLAWQPGAAKVSDTTLNGQSLVPMLDLHLPVQTTSVINQCKEAEENTDPTITWNLFVCTQFLAVPVETKVHLYERGSWDHVSTLSDDLLTQVRTRRTQRCRPNIESESLSGLFCMLFLSES